MVSAQSALRTLRFAAGIMLLLSPIASARAQGTVIRGTVTQLGSSEPIPATVSILTMNLVAVASDQGRYTLTVPEGRASGQTVQITARFIGYQPVTKTITLTAESQSVNFELKSDPFRLTEIVTTGTADGQAANKLPFSVAVVNGDKLRDVPASSPIAALAGKVAGARIDIREKRRDDPDAGAGEREGRVGAQGAVEGDIAVGVELIVGGTEPLTAEELLTAFTPRSAEARADVGEKGAIRTKHVGVGSTLGVPGGTVARIVLPGGRQRLLKGQGRTLCRSRGDLRTKNGSRAEARKHEQQISHEQ